MFSSLVALSLAAILPSALATVYVTEPVASTSLAGGKPAAIKWQDDGNAPTLANFGPAAIALCVGSQIQQIVLQVISTNTDVSKVNTINWTPTATVGPDSDAYFIKFTSNGLQDVHNPQYPAEAFSAKFRMTDMTGAFNSTIMGLINGASSAGTAAPTTPAASSSGTGASKAPLVTTTAVQSSASAHASSSSNANGAGRIVAHGVLGATGVAALALAFFL
ncbi:hypothetical protein BGW80DRAFT_1170560 [Lactifluus volemus]|nr:hypothetical protein BGW80DRAFT_1170560 [Lactifluus volemus]